MQDDCHPEDSAVNLIRPQHGNKIEFSTPYRPSYTTIINSPSSPPGIMKTVSTKISKTHAHIRLFLNDLIHTPGSSVLHEMLTPLKFEETHSSSGDYQEENTNTEMKEDKTLTSEEAEKEEDNYKVF